MKTKVLLIALLAFISAKAQTEPLFDKDYFRCENQWVLLPKKQRIQPTLPHTFTLTGTPVLVCGCRAAFIKVSQGYGNILLTIESHRSYFVYLRNSTGLQL